ncbi:membrane-spanning 4-domains subfamily A member 15 isoform X2 [Petaurus breviceps papuanus]|uniref:membrane-spanning 4-domains subfamily A member 15 isoform X2 n=1 Tax=Petaurus breviceps papuanus TaxID=3040969 RepID=UPI0036D94749
MTSAPATNGVFVVIPPNNASGIRPGPAMLPRTLCQSPGTLQFEDPPLGSQPPGNVPHQQLPPGETFLNGEPKALGFIISGSLSVAAEKHHTSCLVKSSLGMNIINVIASFAATAILLMDFGVTNWDVGRGYLAVLTIFTILEFFIAVIATYFGCQATRSNTNTSMVFLPNAFSTDFNIPSPAATPPPAYDNVAYASKETSE